MQKIVLLILVVHIDGVQIIRMLVCVLLVLKIIYNCKQQLPVHVVNLQMNQIVRHQDIVHIQVHHVFLKLVL
jgi:hypothetical protein